MVTVPLPRPTRVVVASPFRGLHEGAALFDQAVPDPATTVLDSLAVIDGLLELGEPHRPRRSGREPRQWTQVLMCVSVTARLRPRACRAASTAAMSRSASCGGKANVAVLQLCPD